MHCNGGGWGGEGSERHALFHALDTGVDTQSARYGAWHVGAR